MGESLVFHGVSACSMGNLLKGYGVMAVIGEKFPDAKFWWDNAFHLVVEDNICQKEDVVQSVKGILPELQSIAVNFKRVRKKEKIVSPYVEKILPELIAVNFKRTRKNETNPLLPSILEERKWLNELPPALAEFANSVCLPISGREKTLSNPLFPSHGQDARANYFVQIEKACEEIAGKKATKEALEDSRKDLNWSLFDKGNSLNKTLISGYLFFPNTMKRYATGIKDQVREKDAPVSPWCYLLAIRGALLFRGSNRRMLRRRKPYPTFPFMFEETKGAEVHLPTWTAQHPRTLGEFLIQVRQFQFHARLGAENFAATSAEFRAAVQERGISVAFGTFHRFVLEARRPGQRRNLSQAIPRGRTSPKSAENSKLRLMLAPLGNWVDQFTSWNPDFGVRIIKEREILDKAIHRAIDEATAESYLGILAALWELNQKLLRGTLQQAIKNRTPCPFPLLPAKEWEPVLAERFKNSPAFRIARAIASIQGDKQERTVGPILGHLLPLRLLDRNRGWVFPDPEPSRPYRWVGLNPLREFGALFWKRWLDAAKLNFLPFHATRTARLADVICMLNEEVDVAEVHRLVGRLALLDWRKQNPCKQVESDAFERCVLPSPSYAALRAWFELGIKPPDENGRSIRDNEIARLLTFGNAPQVERAVEKAISRLAIHGLPRLKAPRPIGKAVARFHEKLTEDKKGEDMAARMVLAIMIPISPYDTRRLSRQLWVLHETGQNKRRK